MIQTILTSGKAKPGHEFDYALAWKHRARYGWLHAMTPFWHWRKRDRRWRLWMKAINRVHEHGEDVFFDYDLPLY